LENSLAVDNTVGCGLENSLAVDAVTKRTAEFGEIEKVAADGRTSNNTIYM